MIMVVGVFGGFNVQRPSWEFWVRHLHQEEEREGHLHQNEEEREGHLHQEEEKA